MNVDSLSRSLSLAILYSQEQLASGNWQKTSDGTFLHLLVFADHVIYSRTVTPAEWVLMQ
jgi:hypothetical protein